MTPGRLRVHDPEGHAFVVGDVLAAGGEGAIHTLDGVAGLVAKLYHPPSSRSPAAGRSAEALRSKIEYQIANAPDSSRGGEARDPSFWAWPKHTLFDTSGAFVGYAMRRVAGVKGEEFIQFSSGFTWRERVRVALGLARAVRETHAAGYVVGDLNPRNMIVARVSSAPPGDVKLTPTLLDADSFEIRHPESDEILFPCTAQNPEYSAPELINALTSDRSREQDFFTLTVALFQILCLGLHPFSGVAKSGPHREIKDNIARGYSLLDGKYLTPPKAMVDLTVFPPQVHDHFDRTLRIGHTVTRSRASAAEWEQALTDLLGALATCAREPSHHFSSHLNSCPWCTYATQIAADPFDPRLRSGAAEAPKRTGACRVINAPGAVAAPGSPPSHASSGPPSRVERHSQHDTFFGDMPAELRPGSIEEDETALRKVSRPRRQHQDSESGRPRRPGMRRIALAVSAVVVVAAFAVWLGGFDLPAVSVAADRVASIWKPAAPTSTAPADATPPVARSPLPSEPSSQGQSGDLTLRIQACIDGDQREPYDCTQPRSPFPGVSVLVQNATTTLAPDVVRNGDETTLEFHRLSAGVYRVRIDDARLTPAFSPCPSTRPELDSGAAALFDLESDRTVLVVYCAARS